MQWNKSYTAKYYAMTVDPDTWKDDERFGIENGSASLESTGLRGSAEFASKAEGYNERLVRIYIDAVQNDDIEHVPVFTGYAVSPTLDVTGTLTSQKYTCYSILKPADDVMLDRGWYAPINANAYNLVKDLLSVTRAPFDTDGDVPTLGGYIVAENGETRLSMVDKILQAVDRELVIDGEGKILVRPRKAKEDITFSPTNDVIETDFSISNDWYNVPNVLRVVMDDVSAIARDDSENSIYSTASRGREIWLEENAAEIANGDTLAEYAKRRLKALQAVGTKASYTRRYIPNITVCDVVRLRYELLNGLYKITSQKISLSHNVTTSETAERIDV